MNGDAMTPYVITIEFDIVRRIGWSDDDLGKHLDEVFDRLRQADGVRAMDAEADLDSGRSTIAMRYMTFAEDAEMHGRTLLGIAIRSCGGAHHGLLPFAIEAAHKPERNQWSGLRTPSWNVRQVTFGIEPDTE